MALLYPEVQNEFILKYLKARNLFAFRYVDRLKQLADIGFSNEELNIDLLQKHGGEIHPVVEELLAYQ